MYFYPIPYKTHSVYSNSRKISYTRHLQNIPLTMSTSDKSTHARLQNDFGADYWVRNRHEQRVCLPDLAPPRYTLTPRSNQPLGGVSLPGCKMSSTTMSTMAGRRGSRRLRRRGFWGRCGVGESIFDSVSWVGGLLRRVASSVVMGYDVFGIIGVGVGVNIYAR